MADEPVDLHAVLLVEDHEGTRRALSQLLTMHAFNVCTATTVAEAIARLGGQAFLILDMHLPDGLGLTVLREANGRVPRMRVAVCSGSHDGKLMGAVERERPDRIFSKPIDFRELRDWMLGCVQAG